VMKDGVIQQIGSPTSLYDRPANRFVASFIGRTNFFEGEIAAGETTFRTKGGLLVKTVADGRAHAELMVRPEMIGLSAVQNGQANCFEGVIVSSVFLGGNIEIVVRLASGDGFTVITTIRDLGNSGISAEVGRTLNICFSAESAILM